MPEAIHKLSTGLILTAGKTEGRYDDGKLILVARTGPSDGLLWGLPAGHVKDANLLAEVRRESSEETGIPSEQLTVLRGHKIISVKQPTGEISVGSLFFGNTESPVVNQSSGRWQITDPDDDIVVAKSFTHDEVHDLVSQQQHSIFKQEFNSIGMLMWLYELYIYDVAPFSNPENFELFIQDYNIGKILTRVHILE